MKKTSAIIIVACVILLAAAVTLMGTVGLCGKAFQGGTALQIAMGKSFDSEAVAKMAEEAGFGQLRVLASARTTFEVESAPMDEAAIAAAQSALLSSLATEYPDAVITYAQPFSAPSGARYLPKLLYAFIAFVVIAYLYAAIRFGFCKGLSALLPSLVAAVATGSIIALCSAFFAVGSAATAVIAGVACFTYVCTISDYASRKSGSAPQKGDLAAPLIVIVGAVLVCASCASFALTSMAVLGALLALISVRTFAPIFWAVCEK